MTTATPLVLFNSLSRSAELFAPIDPALVRIYSCGPTVYARQHLGNMRAYIFADTLRRTIEWKGWPVRHVVNITDVGHLTSDADTGDDKMEKAAARERLSARDIAARYTDLFKQDLDKLNVRAPFLWSVATEHVDDMIAFAERIGGSTYEAPSGLYFDTTTVPGYGALAGGRDGPEVGRIDPVAGKRHPSDFAIWRRSEDPGKRQMEWPSPWGVGAPGWHLECSVMSMKYLAEPFGQSQFDIHTGGIDHREIHHPNEIAQNQAYTGSAGTGANFWMHNNFLVERGQKMSKSAGGFATLDTLIDGGVHPLAYRLLCLSAHYRSELEFSIENVLAALTRLKRLVLGVSEIRKAVSADVAELSRDALSDDGRALLDRFDEALCADLMTPQALPVLETVLATGGLDADERWRLIVRMDEALGLGLPALQRSDLRIRPANAPAGLTPASVEEALSERRAAREARDFPHADALRAALIADGVEIMDGDPLGWDWRPQLG